ncbi:UDP-N-acetylglucosamine 4,6-dehydratase (inverting) [Pelagibacteraceae bacterium]|jgi:UDP-N-acetylglucosamine 4,6-dehydratase/5-epimerase|nr:UDP-N-acetylglucosamine 4,6-dehydratase (inverting) [Pelagibacteraceae bacterium]|tara:strand:- start:606 stop:1622 length:1017 start_codon:yes stop_codon:yes gene_type:complete
MFNNKCILVTGGTGFFGSNFVKCIFKKYKPKKVIVFSRDESKQFDMQNELCGKKYKGLKFFIGDVRDKERLLMAFDGVDYVVHAAALKHVPAAEYNPMECIKTNIYGAENIIQAAISCGVKKVIALSTDKAANPINIYGATKLASDKLFVAANNLVGKKLTRFSVVRYGNVLSSRGSVIPFFYNLIKSGTKELPLTDIKMTRFVILIEEGIDFVFKSFERMSGGEIYVPKIPSIKILDLIKAIFPSKKYKIIGIRPGEKIHEILCPIDDNHLTYEYKDHFVIAPTIKFFTIKNNFKSNRIKEKGKIVQKGFEYQSGSNPKILTISQIKKLLVKINDTI